MYVILDADGDLIREQGETLGMDIRKLESEKKLCILDMPLNRQLRLNIFRLIEVKAKEYNVKRIVFDSLSSFMFNINQFNIQLPNIDNLSRLSKEDVEYLEEDIANRESSIPEAIQKLKPDPLHYGAIFRQRMVYLMFREFSTLGTTNVVITSASSKNPDATVDGVSEFVADGVVVLDVQQIAKKAVRSIRVQKMRNTKQDIDSFVLDLSDKGLAVEEERVFTGSKISGINP